MSWIPWTILGFFVVIDLVCAWVAHRRIQRIEQKLVDLRTYSQTGWEDVRERQRDLESRVTEVLQGLSEVTVDIIKIRQTAMEPEPSKGPDAYERLLKDDEL